MVIKNVSLQNLIFIKKVRQVLSQENKGKNMIQRSDSLLSDAQESQNLQIFVSCRNLANLDVITTTDSFLVIKLQQNNKPLKQVLRTRVYDNDLNPNYAQSLLIKFVFQIKQKLFFQVYHESKPPKLVGKIQTTLGEIFGSPEHGLLRDLMNTSGKKQGKIVIRCEKEENNAQNFRKFINLKIKAKNLPNIKSWWFFGGTCAFFRIIRRRDKDQLLVYESEVINYSTEPSFKQFKLSERKLARNDQSRGIEIRFYNFSSVGNHELLGSATFSLKQLEKVRQYKLLLNNKQQRGMTIFETFDKQIQYSFMDYINANLQLSLVTCIDFTASNGQPTQKNSLHYYDKKTQSTYEKALSQVVEILLNYDHDKLVPVYGFGAKVFHPNLDTQGKVHHCFPINGNQQNPNLYGKNEIINEYRNILKHVSFSGPTYFAELIKQAINQCKQFQKSHNQYMILFIITDGQIHDKKQTIDLIISCNRLPISIIIVGVGNSDFAIMKELDDDECKMTDSKGKRSQRDLVQFVVFEDFNNDSVELAKAVLEQLPRQVAQYYQLMHLSPKDIGKNENNQQDDVARIIREIKLKRQEEKCHKINQSNPYF